MKKLVLLIIVLIIALSNYSQDVVIINFDNEIGLNQVIIDSNSVWQIGKPNKNSFNEAHTLPNAIVTDTLNSYPINDTSIFYIIQYEEDILPNYARLAFDYQINCDSLTDFGFLEASFNGGETWINLIEDFEEYDMEWIDEIPNFTGDSYNEYNNGWNWAWINVTDAFNYFPKIDSLIYKFTFISDSVQTNKDGWIIDNIELNYIIEGINENRNNNFYSILYPNPIENNSILILNNRFQSELEIEIIDLRGQIVKNYQNIISDQLVLNRNEFENGLYIYLIYNGNRKIIDQGKFIRLSK